MANLQETEADGCNHLYFFKQKDRISFFPI